MLRERGDGREDLVLQAAHAFEKRKRWDDHWPDVTMT
jgi:hypothetical protein